MLQGDNPLKLEPGDTHSQESRIIGLERLATVKPQHIEAVACAKAVLFADGSVERFDQPAPDQMGSIGDIGIDLKSILKRADR